MRNPIYYIRKSLSAKISVWIVLFSILILYIALGYVSTKSVQAVQREAISRATQVLNNTVQKVENILTSVETASNNIEWFILRHLDKPDMMFDYSRHIVATNPFLDGCSISFEPYYFPEKGRYFSAYSRYYGDEVQTEQEGKDSYDYFCMDWYLGPKLLDRPCWTEPYFDSDPDESYSVIITSYCKPLKDEQGKFIGSLSVDVPLQWLSNTIESAKPYPNSFALMIGRGGHFYVHPGTEELFYETIFTRTLIEPNPVSTELGHAMIRGEEGMRQIEIMGKNYYVFFKPIPETGWSVGLFCPEADIFAGYNRLQLLIIAITVLGLLLMHIVFVRIVSKELRPLRRLADQTDAIAKGNFNKSLPDIQRIDEIGQLSHSFTNMQQSLVNYINELKSSTAAKAALDNELRVATDIQMSMLPRVFPPFPERKDIDLFASMTPAKEVGGDLYNFLLHDNCLYFTVGDVSGKGIPAALFMAQATRLFRTLAGEGLLPEAIANRMNSGLCEGNDTMMFVTMFIGVIHLDSGMLEFCNCGHNPPLLDHQFIKFQNKNRPLGLFDGIPFKGETIDNIRGKKLLVYTDGLNEAMNNEREQFGDERIIQTMANSDSMTACQVVETLRAAVEVHRNGAEPNDDLTLLCLKIS